MIKAGDGGYGREGGASDDCWRFEMLQLMADSPPPPSSHPALFSVGVRRQTGLQRGT